MPEPPREEKGCGKVVTSKTIDKRDFVELKFGGVVQ